MGVTLPTNAEVDKFDREDFNDKAGPGPWDNEPDVITWRSEMFPGDDKAIYMRVARRAYGCLAGFIQFNKAVTCTTLGGRPFHDKLFRSCIRGHIDPPQVSAKAKAFGSNDSWLFAMGCALRKKDYAPLSDKGVEGAAPIEKYRVMPYVQQATEFLGWQTWVFDACWEHVGNNVDKWVEIRDTAWVAWKASGDALPPLPVDENGHWSQDPVEIIAALGL